jgi:hypothetical protein
VDIEKQIRKLARSVYWQNIYRTAKELNIHLFENQSNFSGLQSLFLFWLNVYETLYSELSNKEWKYLDSKVIDSDIRCDAFLYWRSQIKEQELDNHKREEKASKLNFKGNGNVSMFDIDFRGDK